MSKKILIVKNLVKHYGTGHTEVSAVDGVNLNLKEGEVVLIMGPSGSGKTTFLSLVGGLLKPSHGSVFFEGQEISKSSQAELTHIRLHHIGFIFQTFLLLSSLSALENVQIVRDFTGKPEKETRKKAIKLLTDLGLGERIYDIPANLSGGEKQRVSIARALINDPDLLLADEPTANLDSAMCFEIGRILRKTVENGKRSVIIVSHDERLKQFADRTVYMEDGKFIK